MVVYSIGGAFAPHGRCLSKTSRLAASHARLRFQPRLGIHYFFCGWHQQLLGPWGQHLGYLPFISTWDSSWYGQIAQSGYPSKLPYDSTGAVAQNPWAFYPLFPLIAGGINRITGIGYYPVAATVALLAGFAAAWVIYLLFTTSLNIVGYRDQSHGEKASEAASSTEDPKDVKPHGTIWRSGRLRR